MKSKQVIQASSKVEEVKEEVLVDEEVKTSEVNNFNTNQVVNGLNYIRRRVIRSHSSPSLGSN